MTHRIPLLPLFLCAPLMVACGSAIDTGSSSEAPVDAPASTTLAVQAAVAPAAPRGRRNVLAVSRIRYEGNTFGSTGTYPSIFNDPSITGIQGSIHVDKLRVKHGAAKLRSTVDLAGISSSFSSKSEGAVMLSVDARFLTYMGYAGPVGAEGVSNSYTTQANLAGNADPLYDREIALIRADGTYSLTTEANAYSGDNPRAAITVDGSQFYMAGNADATIAKDGTGPGTTIGARYSVPGSNVSIELGAYFAADRPDETAKQHVKDSNFRAIGIYGGNIYVAKGSGGNGDDGGFQVGTGLPTTSGNPIAKLFGAAATDPTTKAASPVTPFGFWFADANTLYVADEGYPTVDANGNLVADPLAGLQKWSFVAGSWQLDYTLQTGLDLLQPETVPGYPVPSATYGLRNMTGKVRADGKVTIYAITAQYSTMSNGEPDPTRLVVVNDALAATTLPAGESFRTVLTSAVGEVFRGVAFAPRANSDGSDDSDDDTDGI